MRRGAATQDHSFALADWKREATSLPCLIGMQAAQCVYEEREERESERGSSQCNGIEESEEEEEESE